MSRQKFTKEELKDKLDGNELDLSMCNLSKVPVREIASLPKATILDLSCNVLTTLPPTFSSLTQLTKLDLSKNSLTELPVDFGHLNNLERLDLYSNKLTTLPVSCIHLKNLKWLDLKGNPIQTSLPDVVGNCLSAEECKQCAINMISYLKRENAEEERIRQKHLKAEREKKFLDEANASKERELRRRQKLKEKEERRLAFQEMEKQKKLMSEEVEERPPETDFVKDEPQSHRVEETKGKMSFLRILIILGWLLGIFGLLYLYCKDKDCVLLFEELWK